MSLLPVDALAASLVDIPSTTGHEENLARHLATIVGGMGFEVQLSQLAPERMNLWAIRPGEAPRVILCTHLDTVPPFIPARLDETTLWGRGACDAKGIIAAMLHASIRLHERGIRGVALLFLAGEEADHCGALAARSLLPRGVPCVVGEPTESVLASAQKGLLKVRIRARGKAGHSGYPEMGESAVHALVAALVSLLAHDWPHSGELGATTLNVGTISGGVAANVLAPSAEALLLFRLSDPMASILATLRRLVAGLAPAEEFELDVIGGTDPVRLSTISGFPTGVVAFNTDIPYLAPDSAYLYGPGSIRLAHSAEERVGRAELFAGVESYVRLVEAILALPPQAR